MYTVNRENVVKACHFFFFFFFLNQTLQNLKDDTTGTQTRRHGAGAGPAHPGFGPAVLIRAEYKIVIVLLLCLLLLFIELCPNIYFCIKLC